MRFPLELESPFIYEDDRLSHSTGRFSLINQFITALRSSFCVRVLFSDRYQHRHLLSTVFMRFAVKAAEIALFELATMINGTGDDDKCGRDHCTLKVAYRLRRS
jgi:hypothetical protein